MKKRPVMFSLVFLCLLLLVGFACQLTDTGNVAATAISSTPASTENVAEARPSATEAVSPTPTLLPATAALPPVATLLSEPTRPPLTDADLPVHTGTALPRNAELINLDNASRLRLLGLWGLGSPQGLVWSPDGSRAAIGYQAGVLVFDSETGRELYRIRTAGWLAGLDLSPDGDTLALAHADGALEFYRFSDGALVGRLEDLFTEQPVSLRYLPGGEFLLAGLSSGMVDVIPTQSDEAAISSIFGDYGYPVDTLCISPDGQRVVLPGDDFQGMAMWNIADPENPQVLYYLPGTADLPSEISMAFSPDGRWLAASNWDEMLLLWDVSGASALQEYRLLFGSLDDFGIANIWRSLAFSADSRFLAAGGLDGAVWLWDIASAAPLRAVQAGSTAVEFLSYAPDGDTLAAALADGQVVLLQSESLEIMQSLQTGDSWFGSLAALSGDGQFLATATQAELGDGTQRMLPGGPGLYLRNFADGSVVRQMDLQSFPVLPGSFVGLGLSSAGRWLAASPLGLPLGVWDTETGELTFLLEGQSEYNYLCDRVRFSPDDRLIAAGCMGDSVYLWQAASGAYLHSLSQEDSDTIAALAFSPDGSLLASAGVNSRVHLWNPTSGALLRTLEVFDVAPITDLAFSLDGKYLATATGRNYPKAVIWDVASGEEISWLGFNDAVSAAAFSPDGVLLAVAINFEHIDKLEIWDWQSQNLLAAVDYQTDISRVFFSPDGHYVITISQDGMVRIWGVYT